MPRRIVVVVGEPSGDRLGAQLITELRKTHPDIEVEGVFGAEMINAGCLQLHTMDTLAVMGLIDPIKSLPSILRLRKWLISYILKDPPDLFIGIDAPEFNLGLEKILHAAGVQTVHYVSPSVWAWRQNRIKTIKSGVDLMLTLFPFEAEFYVEHDVPVCYTGHPTADIIPFVTDKAAGKEALGFEKTDQVMAVLPGSRNSEMKHMVPTYIAAMKICAQHNRQLRFVVPLVQAAYQTFIEFWKNKLAPELEIKYVVKDSFAVMRAADVALVTSGTATLEVMLHKIPMVVAYKTDWLTYQVGKRLIKTKYIALPNLLADDPVVPELIQNAATPQQLADALLALMDNVSIQYKQVEKFNELHKILEQDASFKAAAAITELLYPEAESVMPEIETSSRSSQL
ncbi:MAG TPA: lipid-A-disaccharide synthase [Gammaproteobacteria bacterium]|nr:lipid-A-disaccharide synthase [Gammaproteobacteria bacterium]